MSMMEYDDGSESNVDPSPQMVVRSVDGVVTAQRVAVPRNIPRIMSSIKALAAMAGDDWYYSWQVKDRSSGKHVTIEGPSIDCAMAIAAQYGNNHVSCDVEDSGQFWVFQARFTDLETGFTVIRPFQQRKSQTTMKTKDADRQLDIAFQIGTSKATRNVICKAIPHFAKFAFEMAKQNLVERVGKDLPKYLERVLQRLEEASVAVERVERVYGRKAAEWRAQEVSKIIAELQSVKDGMSTFDDIYPSIVSDAALETDEKKDQSKVEKLFDELEVGLFSCLDEESINQYLGENQAAIVALGKNGKDWAVKWAAAVTKQRGQKAS